MIAEEIRGQVLTFAARDIPLPGGGETASRHRLLFDAGRMGLSLARLFEAHSDALAILAEAHKQPEAGVLYGVWASERPGHPVEFEQTSNEFLLRGEKGFCSGAGIVDRALVTALIPEPRLIDVDLRSNENRVAFDTSVWKTGSFLDTRTATVSFSGAEFSVKDFVGGPNWYLERPGFWHGACGPAACWAGGAAGLLDYAMQQKRSDSHTLAHLGAMHAAVWAMNACLETAGREIDTAPADVDAAIIRALTVRHVVEQASTDILRRLTRAFGPHPLAMDEAVAQRYHELDLYLRQSHAERDLEALGSLVRSRSETH